MENERIAVLCSRCRENLKFGNFTLSFGRLRQRIELKCVLHVQHGYFSSFNQSEHCFLASSLPLPSSLLKLPSISFAPREELIFFAYQIGNPQFLSVVQFPFDNCHSPFSPTTFFEIGVYHEMLTVFL